MKTKDTATTCDHLHKTPHWDHVECEVCRAVYTDEDWGIAKHRWFHSIDAARFYQQHGRLPEALK